MDCYAHNLHGLNTISANRKIRMRWLLFQDRQIGTKSIENKIEKYLLSGLV